MNEHYNEVLPGKLYVGDKNVAEDSLMLELMGVTHIVSCGFEYPLQPASKYTSFCINIMDVPDANLLQYLPRACKFIESVKEGAVYIHCVHGQSRSCSVCVAFLMRQEMKKAHSSSGDNLDILHSCYNRVMQCRPSMAVNPGFVRQLDLFRRMGCALVAVANTSNSSSTVSDNNFILRLPLSKAHATFRSFRAKTEFQEHSTVLHKFQDASQVFHDSSSYQLFSCSKCRTYLFCSHHILDEWTETTTLPLSDYWADSFGGKEYTGNNACLSNVGLPTNCIEVEPIEWMRSQMTADHGLLIEKGKLNCPSCNGKIGFWDWKFPQLISAIFIQSTKVTVATNKSAS